ncbi:MAG: DUF1830 domain-containing protein [Chroococcales cyanobacterium]
MMLNTNLQTSILDNTSSSEILCFYLNNTNHLQILKSRYPVDWVFEKVIFPGQRILFKGLTEAQLEVHTCVPKKILAPDVIFCKEMKVL